MPERSGKGGVVGDRRGDRVVEQTALPHQAHGAREADILMQSADEYGIPWPDDIGTTHWVAGDHIHIGPVSHIPVRP